MGEEAPDPDDGTESAAAAAAAVAAMGERMKEAAYVAVGLGVLGFQSFQVKRREVAKQVEPQVREAAEALQRLAAAADEAVRTKATRAR